MSLREWIIRLAIAGLGFGVVLGLLRGDIWSLATVREGLIFAALLGALLLIDKAVRRVARNFAKPS